MIKTSLAGRRAVPDENAQIYPRPSVATPLLPIYEDAVARRICTGAGMLSGHATLSPPPDEQTLTDAAAPRDIDGVRRALEAGVSPNVDSGSPLLLAAGNGDEAIPALLLSRGADPSLTASHGFTP